MAEIMGLFGQSQLRFAALEFDRSAGRPQQPGDQPQQRGFAGAVGAGDGQGAARGGLKIKAGEHFPAAPHTPDATSQQPHFAPSQPSGNYR
jgi:hypothetical protein